MHGGCFFCLFLFFTRFTHLGPEFQDLLNLCDRMHLCTDKTSIYTLIPKSAWNGVRTHVNSKEKIPLPLKKKKILLRERSNPRHCIKQDSDPTTLPTELFWPERKDAKSTQCSQAVNHLSTNWAHYWRSGSETPVVFHFGVYWRFSNNFGL